MPGQICVHFFFFFAFFALLLWLFFSLSNASGFAAVACCVFGPIVSSTVIRHCLLALLHSNVPGTAAVALMLCRNFVTTELVLSIYLYIYNIYIYK